MLKRKGQASAAGAATLVVVITLLILLYLIFLPSDARSSLIGGDSGDSGKEGPTRGQMTNYQNTLLSQNVGRVFPPAPDEVEHNIPSFTIFTSTNAMELKRTPGMAVKKGIFTDESGSMTFVYDAGEMSEPMLSFNAKKSGGRLLIKLNGAEIFNSELESASPSPISLPVSLLKQMNELVFEAESPGGAFWKINTHELSNIIVSAEVTDRSAASANQHFSISPSEYDMMNQAHLSFLPNCDPRYTGRLTVSLNNREIYSGFADCGVPNKMEVAKEYLFPGANSVSFVSGQGQYLVDLVKLTTKMNGQDVPVFYFNLPNIQFERIYYGDALLFLSLRFTDARAMKSGVLNLNGFESTFQTTDLVYQTQVDPEFLLPGPNSVMIMPQGQALDIVELRIEST